MAGYAHITRCAELTEDDIVTSLAERKLAKALLERMARVARPAEGAPKILHFLARMAGAEVAWIEGTLRIEVEVDADGVTIEVLGDLGGVRERLFPLLKMGAPFKEFARMVDHMPRTIEPLVVVSKAPNKLVLEGTTDEQLRTSMPAVAIADDSLYRGGRRTTRPKVGMKASAPPPMSVRSTSSAKLRAARRASAPEVPQVQLSPVVIPSRTGNTLRPAVVGAPAPTRNKTLVPDRHAVPPPIPAVPQAPRIPRVDPDDGPRSDRTRARRTGVTSHGPVTPSKPSAPPKAAEPAPKAKRGSKPKVDPKAGESHRPASKAPDVAPDADDFDWEMPAADTVLPGGKKQGSGGTLMPDDAPMPPPLPAMPPARLPRVEHEEGPVPSKSRRMKAVGKPAKKNERTRTTPPRLDPRAEGDEEDESE